MLTREDLVEALPPRMRKTLNDAAYNAVVDALSDKDEFERFKENFISYTIVLQEGKYTTQQYIDAIKYVSFKNMGYTNVDAFRRTFPEKIKRYKAEGKSDAEVHNFVSGFNRSKLVTAVIERTVIPLHVLNQEYAQKAITRLVRVMAESNNDLAVVKAADSLLNHLKPPVETKVTLDIGVQETSAIQDLKEETKRLASLQKEMIDNGTFTARQVAEMRVVGEAQFVELP